jgi:hypothetical protein
MLAIVWTRVAHSLSFCLQRQTILSKRQTILSMEAFLVPCPSCTFLQQMATKCSICGSAMLVVTKDASVGAGSGSAAETKTAHAADEGPSLQLDAVWNGKKFAVTISQRSTVGGLKRKLQEATGVLAKRQKLILKPKKAGTPLSDECKLDDVDCSKKNFMMIGVLEENAFKDIELRLNDDLQGE